MVRMTVLCECKKVTVEVKVEEGEEEGRRRREWEVLTKRFSLAAGKSLS